MLRPILHGFDAPKLQDLKATSPTGVHVASETACVAHRGKCALDCDIAQCVVGKRGRRVPHADDLTMLVAGQSVHGNNHVVSSQASNVGSIASIY